MRQLYSIQRLKRQKLEQLELMMNETSEFLELVLKEFEYFDDISLSQELNKLTEMVIRIRQIDMTIDDQHSFTNALYRFINETLNSFNEIENHSKLALLTLYDEILNIIKTWSSFYIDGQSTQIYEITFPNFLQCSDEVQEKLIPFYRQADPHVSSFYDLRNKLYSVEKSIEKLEEDFETTALKSKKELIQKLRVLNHLYLKVESLTEIDNIAVFNSLIKTLPIVISCFDDLSEEEKTELLTHCWFLTHFRNLFFYWQNKIEERENVFEIINNIIHFMSHYFSSMSQGSQRELISCYRYQQGLFVRMSMSDEERWKRTKEIIDITLPLLGDIDTETRTIIILLVAQCLKLTQEQEFRDIADEAFIQLSWLTKQYFFELSDDTLQIIFRAIYSYQNRLLSLDNHNDSEVIEKINALVDFCFIHFEYLGSNTRKEILSYLSSRVRDIYLKDSSVEKYILQRNQISTFILPYFPTLNHEARDSLILLVTQYTGAFKEMVTLDVALKEQAIKINTKLAITALPYLPQSPDYVQERIIHLFHHTGGLLATKEKQNEFYKFGISCVTPFNHLLYPSSRNSLINLYYEVAQNASVNKDYAKTISICNDAFYLIMPFRDKQVEKLRVCLSLLYGF